MAFTCQFYKFEIFDHPDSENRGERQWQKEKVRTSHAREISVERADESG